MTKSFFTILFNYYAKGSFKYILQEEDLAIGIDCYSLFEDYRDGIFVFKFTLTNNGKKNVSKILKHFYSFVDYLKTKENKKEIYDFIAKITRFGFLFNVGNAKLGISETERDFFYQAKQMSKFYQDYDGKDLFKAGHVFEEYNEDKFMELLNEFDPKNSIYYYESKDFKVKGEKEKPKMTMKRHPKEVFIDPKTIHPDNSFPFRAKRIASHPEFDLNKLNKEVAKSNRIIKRLLKHKKRRYARYLLSDNKTDPSLVTLGEKYQIFDSAIDNILLEENFDFDDNKPYELVKLDDDFLVSLTVEEKEAKRAYTIVEPGDLSYINEYQILTTCNAPYELLSNSIFSSVNQKTSLLNGSGQEVHEEFHHSSLSSMHLNTEKTYAAIFDPNNQDNSKPSDTIANLNMYKDCLKKDFNHDNGDQRLHFLNEYDNSQLYYKLYRKSMQPKFVSIFTIESDFLLENIMFGSEHRTQSAITAELICSYLNRDIEIVFHEDYLKSCTFNCKIEHYEMIFSFQGISTLVSDFSIRVIDYIRSINRNDNINPLILKTIKTVYMDYFMDFETKTSKPLAKYYLNVFLNRIFADYSTEENRDTYLMIVDDITNGTVVQYIQSIFSHCKIMVANVGNVSKHESQHLLNYVQDKINSDQVDFHPALNDRFYKYDLINNLVTKFRINEHLLVRLPNNDPNETNSVYLSYFKLGILDRKEYLLMKVLNHLLKDFMFNRLRNELNLGYVATSFISETHKVS